MALWTAPRSNTAHAYDYANSLVTSRNNILSDSVDRILSFFEWWDWSRLISDEITEYIANLQYTTAWWNSRINDNSDIKRELMSKKSLREKLIFYVSLFEDLILNNAVIVDRVRDGLQNIETEVNRIANFSQKFILRHAAHNRFKVKLNPEEKFLLDSTINELEIFGGKVKLDNYTFHFWQKTDSQKIKKIEEVWRLIYRSNISTEEKQEFKTIVDKAKPLFEKIKPLEDLHLSYDNLSAALNNFYTINRWSMDVLWASSMLLRPTDIRRLKIVLSVLACKNMKTFNMKEYTKELYEKWDIDLNQKLESMLEDSKIGEALKTANLTEEYFSRAFLEHFSQELIIIAKQRLDSQKMKTFWNNKKDFEQDVNAWRENQRQKIAQIWLNITMRWVANPDEIFTLTSYLNTSKHTFRRWSNNVQNANISRALEVALDNSWNMSLAERNTLRDVILNQNENVNDMFYWDNNIFDEKRQTDTNIHNTFNHARRIADKSAIFSQKYWQTTSKFLVWTWLAVWAWVGASIIWFPAILTWLWIAVGAKYWAKWIDKWLNAYHSWLNKDRKGFWKNAPVFPLKLAKFITKPLEWWSHQIDNKTDKLPGAITNTKKWVDDAITNNIWNREFVRTHLVGDKDKVNGVFSALALWVNSLARWSMELTSKIAGIWMDINDTNEKRRIFEWIYSLENAQNLQEFATQTNIQSIIQEDIWLYDNDGFVETLEVNKEKTKEKTWTKEYNKVYDLLSKRFSMFNSDLDTNINTLDNQSVEKQLKKRVQWSVLQLIELVKKPNIVWFAFNLNTLIQRIHDDLNVRNTQLNTKALELRADIWANIVLKNNVSAGRWQAEEKKDFNELIEKDRKKLEDIEMTIEYISNLNGHNWLIYNINLLSGSRAWIMPVVQSIFSDLENQFNLLNPTPVWWIIPPVGPAIRPAFDGIIGRATTEINNLNII